MKKLFAILLAFAMVLSIAACGQTATEEPKTDTPEQTESTEPTDNFPEDNITITVAYSAGGSSDKLARIAQPFLQDELGVNVIVENQGGASGQIATEAFLAKEADGYNLLAVNVPGIYYTVALQDTSYDYDTLVPVWIESYDPIVMLVLNGSPYNTLADFIEDAKANPGKLSVGFASGGGQQATAMWLAKNLDLDIKQVSFDGGSDASAALLGGHVDAIFGDAAARADITSEAKALGIGSPEKNAVWPDAVCFNKQLKEYGVQMPTDEFQARMGCYFVSKEFVEKYPARYEKLIAAFEAVKGNSEYIQMLKDGNLYDSCILASGANYSEKLQSMADEVQNVVAPMFK